jgi:2,5-diketo-D-gluconate reductase A
VVLRFLTQHLGVACIPKSVHAERIRENLASLNFQLTDSELVALAALDRGPAGRRVAGPMGLDPASTDYFPF